MRASAFKTLTALVALAAMTGTAHADLVLINGSPSTSFVDLGAQGFGNAPRMETLQAQGSASFESGSVTPTNVVSGDAISGANKSTTPTLSSLGWTSGANVGIGFNTTENNTGITLDNLVLSIYGTNGTTVLGTFSLASPINFSAADLALQTGNGNGVFAFGLTTSEQATFNSITAMSGSGGFFAGLSASLGCDTGAPAGCLDANGGPESFIGFTAVPGPVAGAGIPGLMLGLGAMLAWYRRKRFAI
jgi:hypothetical protein